MAWCGVVWPGLVWHGLVWRSVAWRGVCGLAWRGVCGMAWCGVVWPGLVWPWPGVAWPGLASPVHSVESRRRQGCSGHVVNWQCREQSGSLTSRPQEADRRRVGLHVPWTADLGTPIKARQSVSQSVSQSLQHFGFTLTVFFSSIFF